MGRITSSTLKLGREKPASFGGSVADGDLATLLATDGGSWSGADSRHTVWDRADGCCAAKPPVLRFRDTGSVDTNRIRDVGTADEASFSLLLVDESDTGIGCEAGILGVSSFVVTSSPWQAGPSLCVDSTARGAWSRIMGVAASWTRG